MAGLLRGMAALMSSVLAVLVPGTEQASGTYFSPDQAGYAATGARFNTVEIWVKLPDASRFHRELGQVGVSIQLWNSRMVAALTLSACTDARCSPGGKPVHARYRQDFSIFKAPTHALLCSTSTKAARSRCAGVPRGWKGCTVRAGVTVYLELIYDRLYGYFLVEGPCGLPYIMYEPGPGRRFDQARIVAQLGATPWTPGQIRPPTSAVKLMTMGVPPPPPYAAEVGAYSPGPPAGCIGSWPPHHRIAMSRRGNATNRPEAIASRAWQGDCDFSITLEP